MIGLGRMYVHYHMNIRGYLLDVVGQNHY